MEEPNPTQVASQQVVEGSGVLNTPPQETAENPQGNQPPQETPPAQVENGAQPASSTEGARPLAPSEHFEIRKLRNQMRESMAQMERRQNEFLQSLQKAAASPAPQRPTLDTDKLLTDPAYLDSYLAERDKRLKDEWKTEVLEKELPQTMDKYENKKNIERQEQEALELIFPKSPANQQESFEERRDKDPFKRDAIFQIFQQYNLDNIPPKNAAALALKLYETDYKPKLRSPNAPSKAQMASTATGNPIGGVQPLNPQDINRELADMNYKAGTNPALMNDANFRKRWDSLTEQANKILTGVQR